MLLNLLIGSWCRALCVVVALLVPTVHVSGATSTLRHHPNRILILPREDVNAGSLVALHEVTGCQVLRSLPAQGGLQILELPDDSDVQAMVDRYAESGLVVFAEPDYRVSAAFTLPDDPSFSDGALWALNNYAQDGGIAGVDVDAPFAWDIAYSSTNVIVAIIDSGIRHTHEDLTNNLWVSPVDGSHGINGRDGTHDTWDDLGHGTHVAGILGAVGNNGVGVTGVSWQAQIMACKFLDENGDGYHADAVTCIEFARTNGADVINLSWGGFEYSAAVSNAIHSAQSDGILFVAAAGNWALNTDTSPYYPASLGLDNLVSVGASTRTEERLFSSNYGLTTVDLFAPGDEILSTWSNGDPLPQGDNDYKVEDGTSMATAYVSGALALLLEQRPGLTYPEQIERLFAAVDQRSAYIGWCVTGGRLNLRRMLDAAAVTVEGDSVPVQIRLTGVPGHSYTLLGTTNLLTWVPIHSESTGTNDNWLFIDYDSTNLPARFYQGIPSP